MIQRILCLRPLLVLAALTGGAVSAQTLGPVSNFSTQSSALGMPSVARETFTLPIPSSEVQLFTPNLLLPALEPQHPWKKNIVTTVFWVGEPSSANNPTPNTSSSWDANWLATYGGYDDPEPGNRTAGYCPGFTPRQNPFYIALPYNDCVDCNTTKAEAAKVIPWFKTAFQKHGQSVCRNRWIAIRWGGRTCYAQWSDCGPFVTTDAKYVFGDSTPANSTMNGGAALDVSPAVRDYLHLSSGGKSDWRFVELKEVPDGPWKAHGANNPFAPDWKKEPEPGAPIAYVPKTRSMDATGTIRTWSNLPGLVLRTKSR